MVFALDPSKVEPAAAPEPEAAMVKGLVVVPPPLLPPPVPAMTAWLGFRVTFATPEAKADARTRRKVCPAMDAVQVPVEVVEVTAVLLFGGVALTLTQVAPASPETSNCRVPE